jgi:hypothetical protein
MIYLDLKYETRQEGSCSALSHDNRAALAVTENRGVGDIDQISLKC